MSGCEEIHDHGNINTPNSKDEFDRAFSTLSHLDEKDYPEEYVGEFQNKFKNCQKLKNQAEAGIIYNASCDTKKLREEVQENTTFEIPNIGDFEKLLDEADIDIRPLLKEYKHFIESELSFPKCSQMSQEEYQNMIQNIKILLGEQINSQIGDLKKLEEEYGSLKGFSIALNANIKESFQEFSKTVLTSAKFYIDMQNEDFKNRLISSNKYKESKDFQNHIKNRNEAFKEAFIDGKIEDPDEIPSGLFYNNTTLEGWRDWSTDDVTNADNSLMTLPGLDGKTMTDTLKNLDSKISLLNEKDKEIEKKIAQSILALTLLSILPIFGESNDILTLFSDEKEFVATLKKMGIIPEEYVFPPDLLDSVIAGVSVVASVITLGVGGRLIKTARFAEKMKEYGLQIRDVYAGLKDICGYLGVDMRAVLYDLKKMMPEMHEELVSANGYRGSGSFGSEVEDLRFGDFLEEYRGFDFKNLTDAQVRKIAGITDDSKRMALASMILGEKNISPELEKSLLLVHNWKRSDGTSPLIFEHTGGDIKSKLILAKELGVIAPGALTRNEFKQLMDAGILGHARTDIKVESGVNRNLLINDVVEVSMMQKLFELEKSIVPSMSLDEFVSMRLSLGEKFPKKDMQVGGDVDQKIQYIGSLLEKRIEERRNDISYVKGKGYENIPDSNDVFEKRFESDKKLREEILKLQKELPGEEKVDLTKFYTLLGMDREEVTNLKRIRKLSKQGAPELRDVEKSFKDSMSTRVEKIVERYLKKDIGEERLNEMRESLTNGVADRLSEVPIFLGKPLSESQKKIVKSFSDVVDKEGDIFSDRLGERDFSKLTAKEIQAFYAGISGRKEILGGEGGFSIDEINRFAEEGVM
ncbi:MAG: hypothetical protein GY828_02510 [Candidatus Gracilibacteria bacterium]|nr:hypothetical protein [Candidatus Gracilibacteria bacterium]